MTDEELKKEVKEIRKDLDDLIPKIDLLIKDLKEKDSIREAIKDSYQLFVAAIVGTTSGVLIEVYMKYPSLWLISIILVILVIFSVFFSLISYYTFRNRRVAKSLKSVQRRNSSNMAEKDKPTPIDYDSIIDDLIQKIDSDKSLFRIVDLLKGEMTFIIDIFAIVILLIFVGTNHSVSLVDNIVILFAGLAVILTLSQFVIEGAKEDIINLNYRSALNKFKPNENEKPILKALIKMKSKHPKFALSEIHKISPEVFTKGKLLEKLYE